MAQQATAERDPEVVAEFERREAYRIRHNAKVPTYGVSWSGLTGGERIGPTTWEECEEAVRRTRAFRQTPRGQLLGLVATLERQGAPEQFRAAVSREDYASAARHIAGLQSPEADRARALINEQQRAA